ncbi:MAG TPA: alpha/beta fold hydrolase [Terriglobales bacterium]|nr:alpha/beta fold hydrolase [Terriglobales bacterium]
MPGSSMLGSSPKLRLRRALFPIAILALLTLSCFAARKKEQPILHHVGFSFRQFHAPQSPAGEDYNWRGSKENTLDGVVWYPSEDPTNEKEQLVGPPDAPIFSAGLAAKDATIAPSFSKFPLIALSHGTGGSALQMAWLGTYLASRGYIVVAVNHPGNNAVTGYTTQGFIEGWERAKDISTAITDMLADFRFGDKIDPDRIGAAGFSYGGYTMMELAGATTDVSRVLSWCDRVKDRCNPPEMPDLMEKFKAIEQQPDVQKSLQHAGDSYRDPRIRAVFAIAPAVAAAFTPESLHKISIPVEIVAGAADKIAPPAENAQFFAANIRDAKLTILPGGVAHYTFLDVGTDAGKKQFPQLFVDNPGVDRESIHKQVAELAADFFDQQLAPQKKKR